MSVGVTAANQSTVLILSILAFILIPVGFWLITTIIRLIGSIFGISGSSPLPVLVLIIAIPGALLGASLLIDRQGQVRTGQVIDKQEAVYVQGDGSWSDHLSLVVRYSPTGEPIPPFQGKTAALADTIRQPNSQELATVQSSAADYDHLRPGDAVDLRVLRVGTLLSLVRLADQSTRTLVPWGLVEDGVIVVALFALAWQLRKTPLGYGPLAALLVIAMVLPLAYAYQNWRNHENLGNATQHAVAVVNDVTRVSKLYFGTGHNTDTIYLNQPFDVVQLKFVPVGATDPVIAVDAVDDNATGPSKVVSGSSVDVVYPLNNPRAARLLGQSRTNYFQTTLTVYEDYGALLVIVAVLAVAGALIHGIRRRLVPQRDRLT